MSWAIVERTTAGDTERRLQIGAYTIGRKMGIGTTWNQLRIGLQCAFNMPTGNVTGTPNLSIGVCKDTTNLIGMASTDHFVGIKQKASVLSYYNYSASYRYLYGTWYGSKRVGTTDTDEASGVAVNAYISGYPTNERSIFLIEITKGSPNFTIQCAFKNNVDLVEITTAKFKAAMEAATLAAAVSGLGGSAVAGTARTLAVSEASNGYLNSIGVWYDRSTPEFEISEIAFRAIS